MTLTEVAIQTSDAFIETASAVCCDTEIVIIVTCYSDIKIINTEVQITINLSRITSIAMLEEDREDQLERSCEKRRSIT